MNCQIEEENENQKKPKVKLFRSLGVFFICYYSI